MKDAPRKIRPAVENNSTGEAEVFPPAGTPLCRYWSEVSLKIKRKASISYCRKPATSAKFHRQIG